MNKEEIIARIETICNLYPIGWTYILDTIEEGIPLIEHLGPDGLYIAVVNEKLRRKLEN